ncbi:MAG: cytochrome P450 [Burkholderiales bacterium]
MGDAYRAHSPALGRDLWVLSHPDHVRHVLVDHHAKFRKGITERVAILLGNGIMTSEGEHWRIQRKMLQPSFHRSIAAAWMPHIHDAMRKLAARWQQASLHGQPVNVTQDMSEAARRILLALFGDDLHRFGAAFSILTDRASNLAAAYKFRQLGKLILEDVERRRRDGVRRHDIVTLLIEARDWQSGEPMSDRQLLDEIMTLIIAGTRSPRASSTCSGTRSRSIRKSRRSSTRRSAAARPPRPTRTSHDFPVRARRSTRRCASILRAGSSRGDRSPRRGSNVRATGRDRCPRLAHSFIAIRDTGGCAPLRS